MDAFEQLVSEILWAEGYWVRTSVKVVLTKEDKQRISRNTSPRWEIDIVAYSGKENLLRIVECKSYLDSTGVAASGFVKPADPKKDRYKLFNDSILRDVVFNRLRKQLAESGACRENASTRFCLACGKIKTGDREQLGRYFKNNDWDLWDENWLRERLRLLAKGSYENQVYAVVSKLLLRESSAK